MTMPRGNGLAASGHFWLEIEMLPTDKSKFVVTGKRRRPMIWPPSGKGRPLELLEDSRFITKPRTACGFLRCSKAGLGLYKIHMKEFQGSGRRFATSLGTKGVL